MKTKAASPSDDSLILRVTAYGFNNREKFTLMQLRDSLRLSFDEYKFLARHLTLKSRTEQASPNHIIGALTFKIRDKNNESVEDQNRTVDFADDIYDFERTTYMLLSSAYFSYVDHIEVVEARINAKAARISANWAIGISVTAMVISFALGLWQVALASEANQLNKHTINTNMPKPQIEIDL